MTDEYKIRISTEADPSGAEEVQHSLDQVKQSADSVNDTLIAPEVSTEDIERASDLLAETLGRAVAIGDEETILKINSLEAEEALEKIGELQQGLTDLERQTVTIDIETGNLSEVSQQADEAGASIAGMAPDIATTVSGGKDLAAILSTLIFGTANFRTLTKLIKGAGDASKGGASGVKGIIGILGILFKVVSNLHPALKATAVALALAGGAATIYAGKAKKAAEEQEKLNKALEEQKTKKAKEELEALAKAADQLTDTSVRNMAAAAEELASSFAKARAEAQALHDLQMKEMDLAQQIAEAEIDADGNLDAVGKLKAKQKVRQQFATQKRAAENKADQAIIENTDREQTAASNQQVGAGNSVSEAERRTKDAQAQLDAANLKEAQAARLKKTIADAEARNAEMIGLSPDLLGKASAKGMMEEGLLRMHPDQRAAYDQNKKNAQEAKALLAGLDADPAKKAEAEKALTEATNRLTAARAALAEAEENQIKVNAQTEAVAREAYNRIRERNRLAPAQEKLSKTKEEAEISAAAKEADKEKASRSNEASSRELQLQIEKLKGDGEKSNAMAIAQLQNKLDLVGAKPEDLPIIQQKNENRMAGLRKQQEDAALQNQAKDLGQGVEVDVPEREFGEPLGAYKQRAAAARQVQENINKLLEQLNDGTDTQELKEVSEGLAEIAAQLPKKFEGLVSGIQELRRVVDVLKKQLENGDR